MENSSTNDFTTEGLPESTPTSIPTQQQQQQQQQRIEEQSVQPEPSPLDFTRYRLPIPPPVVNSNEYENHQSVREGDEHDNDVVNHTKSNLFLSSQLQQPLVSKREPSEFTDVVEPNFEQQQKGIQQGKEEVVEREEVVEMVDEEQIPGKIRAIDQQSIQRIVAGQAVTDLASAVKELVDNALDASSQNINIRLFNKGLDVIEVTDDGVGVPVESRPYLAIPHATSKIRTFEDIYHCPEDSETEDEDDDNQGDNDDDELEDEPPSSTLRTLGFRGEALFCLANLSKNLFVLTRTADEPLAQRLSFRRDGSLERDNDAENDTNDSTNPPHQRADKDEELPRPTSTETYVPRKVGTTVAVVRLFHPLPVRRVDLERRIQYQRSKLIELLESYAVFSVGVRIHVMDIGPRNNNSNRKRKKKNSVSNATSSNNETNESPSNSNNNVENTASENNVVMESKTLLVTPALTKSLQETVSSIFGAKFLVNMTPLVIDLTAACTMTTSDCNQTNCIDIPLPTPTEQTKTQNSIKLKYKLHGLISNITQSGTTRGQGGNVRHVQLFSINRRPVDLPKVARLINETWRAFCHDTTTSASLSQQQQHQEQHNAPSCVLQFTIPNNMYDINLAPDKRQVLFTNEKEFYDAIRSGLKELWHHQYYETKQFTINKSLNPYQKVPPDFSTYQEDDYACENDLVLKNNPNDGTEYDSRIPNNNANYSKLFGSNNESADEFIASRRYGFMDDPKLATSREMEDQRKRKQYLIERRQQLRQQQQQEQQKTDELHSDSETQSHQQQQQQQIDSETSCNERVETEQPNSVNTSSTQLYGDDNEDFERYLKRQKGDAYGDIDNDLTKTSGEPHTMDAISVAAERDTTSSGTSPKNDVNKEDSFSSTFLPDFHALTEVGLEPSQLHSLQGNVDSSSSNIGTRPQQQQQVDTLIRTTLSEQQEWRRVIQQFAAAGTSRSSNNELGEDKKLLMMPAPSPKYVSETLADLNDRLNVSKGKNRDDEVGEDNDDSNNINEKVGAGGWEKYGFHPAIKRVSYAGDDPYRVDSSKVLNPTPKRGGNDGGEDTPVGDDGDVDVTTSDDRAMPPPGPNRYYRIVSLPDRDDNKKKKKNFDEMDPGEEGQDPDHPVDDDNDIFQSVTLTEKQSKSLTGTAIPSPYQPNTTVWSSFTSNSAVLEAAIQERLALRDRTNSSRAKRKRATTPSIQDSITNDDNSTGTDNHAVAVDLRLDADPNDVDKTENTTVVTLKKEEFRTMKIIGQFNLGFIIAQSCNNNISNDTNDQGGSNSGGGENLWILDQHACDERYNFEKLCRETVIHEQPLLVPLPLELSPMEEDCVLSNRALFEQNGFRFQYEPNKPVRHRFALTALPHSGAQSGRKAVQFTPEDFSALCTLLLDNNTSTTSSNGGGTGVDGSGKLGNNAVRRHANRGMGNTNTNTNINSINNADKLIVRLPKAIAMFASRACRSSVMIGTALTHARMTKIVRRLGGKEYGTDDGNNHDGMIVEQPWDCPHGRPTIKHLNTIQTYLVRDVLVDNEQIATPTLSIMSQHVDATEEIGESDNNDDIGDCDNPSSSKKKDTFFIEEVEDDEVIVNTTDDPPQE